MNKLFKRILAWILTLIMVFSVVPEMTLVTHAETESTEEKATSAFQRVSIDKTTKGNWEGAYGSDVVGLIGYNYPGNAAYDKDTTEKIAINRDNFNYLKTSTTGSYFKTWSWYAKSATGGNLEGYNVEQTNTAVLNMPSESPYNSYQKIEAFNRGFYSQTAVWETYITDGGLLSGLVNTDALAVKSHRLCAYKFTLNDSQPHLFSIYASGSTLGSNQAIVYFLSEDGSKLLLTDTIPAGTFTSGAYVTFMVSGSFIMVTNFVNTDDGVNGFFFDSVSSLTKDLTATSTDEGIVLKWNSTGKKNGQILIERSVDGSSGWETLNTLSDASVTSYTDKAVFNGETYTYRLSSLFGSKTILDDTVSVTATVSGAGNTLPARLSKDTRTSGAWIGRYGTDTAILFGYKYDAKDITLEDGRLLIDRRNYNLQVDNIETPYISAFVPGNSGNLWAYKPTNFGSVLQMPEVDGAGGTAFNAYAVTGYTHAIIAGSPDAGCYDGWIYKNLSFVLNDTDTHILSIYSDKDSEEPGHILIVDEDGNILASDDVAAREFLGGTYLSYPIAVKEAGKKVYVFFGAKSGQAIGISALFMDAPTDNITSGLTVAEDKNVVRTVNLSWNENGQGDKILVARKQGTDGAWKVIASVNAGVKQFTDSDLVPGETYSYALMTMTGYRVSLAGIIKSVAVKAYPKTSITLDSEGYRADDATQKIEGTITLKNSSGVGIAKQQLYMVVDFGHAQQTVELPLTDTKGQVKFSFYPAYLGDAEITVTFRVNDDAPLAGSTKTVVLFVGETAWVSAPVLWEISEGIMPGNLVSLNGYGMSDVANLKVYYAKHSAATAPNTPPANAGTLVPVNTDPVYGCYVVVQLPLDAEPGLYDFWVENANGISNPMVLNTARALFMDEYEAWNGQTIMISGRNLQAQQFGMNAATKVRLVSGASIIEQTLTSISPYSLRFTVNGVAGTTYAVQVSNDNGLTWNNIESEQTLTIVAQGQDPIGLGTAWVDHFNWSSPYINVLDYGAVAGDSKSDTQAFQKAIYAASGQEGGGVVYIPDGEYYVGNLVIPPHTVILGQSTKNTVLYYKGTDATGYMFASAYTTKDFGHQGFANFSIRLADEMVRPDSFFWLGSDWDNGAYDVTIRSASEIFISGIDLKYPITDYIDPVTEERLVGRGLFYTYIINERFIVKDSSFVGYRGNSGNYSNKYTKLLNNYYSYDDGAIGSTAMYNFVIECKNVDADTSSLAVNHGFMMRQATHYEDCWVEGVGQAAHINEEGQYKYINDGEGFCVEMPAGYFYTGSIVQSSGNTVKVDCIDEELPMNIKDESEEVKLRYGRLVVWITAGRGMGQMRDVERINYDTGVITLSKPWDVIPDTTSKFTIVAPLDRVTVYNCGVDNTTKGIYLYGAVYDCVAANNYLEDTEGIFVYSSLGEANRSTPASFITVRDNVLNGPGKAKQINISVSSVRLRAGEHSGMYYSTSVYGIEVRNNILIGDKTEAPHPGWTETPEANGLVSASSDNGTYNYDGICGDNMNIIWENNELQHFVTGIETTLGDYGYIYWGNTFEDVDKLMNDTNTAGTGNHIVDLTGAPRVSKAVLQNMVSIYSEIDSSLYSREAYALLQLVLKQAKDILASDSAEITDIAYALQRLKIAASWQNVQVGGAEMKAILLTETACMECADTDEDYKCDLCGFVIPEVQEAVDGVEDMIDAIGTVTCDSKEAIEEARAAYEALPGYQKEMIENLSILSAAEEAFAGLENGNQSGFAGFLQAISDFFIAIFEVLLWPFKFLFGWLM